MLLRKSPGGNMPICRRSRTTAAAVIGDGDNGGDIVGIGAQATKELGHSRTATDRYHAWPLAAALAVKQDIDHLHIARRRLARHKRGNHRTVEIPDGEDRCEQANG